MKQEMNCKNEESNELGKMSSLLSAIFLFISLVYVFGLGFIWLLQMLNVEMTIGGVIAGQAAILLFAITLFKFKCSEVIDELKKKLTLSNIGTILLLTTAFLLVSTSINMLINHFELVDANSVSVGLSITSSDILALVLGSLIFAPIFEELAFRAGLKRLLVDSGSWKPYQYVIISSTLFSLLHWTPAATSIYLMLITFLMGIAFSIVYLKTKNLWIVIISHMMYNLGVIIISTMV